MTNLNSLDNSVMELEKVIGEIKGFSQIYSQLINLHKEIDNNSDLLKKNSDYLTEVNNNLKGKLENYDKIISAFETKLAAIVIETEKFRDETRKLLIYEMDKIRESEKKQIMSLEESLNSRLDKHKSDIQVEIRNEGAQIQRGFENSLNKNFTDLSKDIKSNFNSVNENIKSNAQDVQTKIEHFEQNLISDIQIKFDETSKKTKKVSVLNYIIIFLILIGFIALYISIK